jgi:thioredoxin reductase (NADPH)
METFDVIVIGQGYAGLSAARLANQLGLRTANIESECMGGLVLNMNELDPAPPGDAHSGAEICSAMAMENMDAGVEQIADSVTAVERDGDAGWVVKTTSEAYRSPNLIVASGAKLKKLGVPGEQELFGRGVSECADCDGPMYAGKPTVVVGAGDSAFQEALALCQFADKVTIVMRGEHPAARRDLVERVATEPKIELLPKARVAAILGDAASGVTGVDITIEGQGARTLPCEGVFVFIGLEPNAAFLPAEVARDASGAVVTTDGCRAGASGLWAIGAVRSGFGGLLTDAAADAEAVAAALS